MNPGWELTPSTEKRMIDANGFLSDTPAYIIGEEKDACVEAHKRIEKYLINGYKKPPGNRFFLLSPDRNKAILLLHDV